MIEDLSKGLLELEFNSNNSIKSCLKHVDEKVVPSLWNKKTYCLSCEKHADNIGSKKVIMTNNMVRKKSKCANFVAEKLRLLKQK